MLSGNNKQINDHAWITNTSALHIRMENVQNGIIANTDPINENTSKINAIELLRCMQNENYAKLMILMITC